MAALIIIAVGSRHKGIRSVIFIPYIIIIMRYLLRPPNRTWFTTGRKKRDYRAFPPFSSPYDNNDIPPNWWKEQTIFPGTSDRHRRDRAVAKSF